MTKIMHMCANCLALAALDGAIDHDPMKVNLLLVSSLCVLLDTQAANITWTNGGGTGNFNTATNWSTGAVPGAADVAIFNATSVANCAINANVNVSGMSINAGYTGTVTQNTTRTITIGTGGYQQAAGTFQGNDAFIDINVGGFVLSGGTFTSTSNFLYIGGTVTTAASVLFTHSGGTFAPNGGTVQLDPFYNSCTQGTYTVDVLPATQFYDVRINATHGCSLSCMVQTAAGDTMDASHDLTHENGTVLGLFSAKHDLWIGTSADGGAGQLIMDGTGAQQYHATAPATRSCFIVINKTSGAATPASGTTAISMQGFWEVQGDFTAPGGTMLIGGRHAGDATILSNQAGTFAHGNGLVELDAYGAACASGVYTIDLIPATRFYDLKLNDPISCGFNSIITTATGDTADVVHDLTHENGYLRGLCSVKHDLWVGTSADGGSGQIIFDGTAAQQYHVATPATRSAFIVVNKASGDVTSATGTTAFSMQGFWQQSGDFTAPSGTMLIGGPEQGDVMFFRHAAGTFSNNNGVVEMDPSRGLCATGTFTVDVIPTTRFHNLKVNGAVGCGNVANIVITASDSLHVLGNLDLVNGAVNTGTLHPFGNMQVRSGYDSGNALLVFGGNAAQLFDLTGATGLYNGDIKLAKTGDNVTLLSDLLMDAASQDLLFSKGDLRTESTALLIIGDNVNATGASDSSFVDGAMRKVGNDAFWFPVGGMDTLYAPIRISAPGSTTDHFTAEYFRADPDPSYPRALKVIMLDHLSICEYWTLDRTNGSSNVAVSLSWAARTGGVSVLCDLRVARWDGSQWTDKGNGGTTGSTTAGNLISGSGCSVQAAVTGFGPFTLASATGMNVLPIELIAFNASATSDHVDLNWSTATEIDNDYFTVERSSDGIVFEEILRTDGSGNSQSELAYSDFDYAPLSGLSYYRLKQTDFDGETTVSDMVPVRYEGLTSTGFKLFPNPASNGPVWLVFTNPAQEQGSTLMIIDDAGREVFNMNMPEGSDQNPLDLRSITSLGAGAYTVTVTGSDRSDRARLIIGGD